MHQFGKKYQVPMLLIRDLVVHHQGAHSDKAHAGPSTPPFVHGDECETSYSLAFFPELVHMEDAVDTKGELADAAGSHRQLRLGLQPPHPVPAARGVDD